jgi:hypothetical protein
MPFTFLSSSNIITIINRLSVPGKGLGTPKRAFPTRGRASFFSDHPVLFGPLLSETVYTSVFPPFHPQFSPFPPVLQRGISKVSSGSKKGTSGPPTRTIPNSFPTPLVVISLHHNALSDTPPTCPSRSPAARSLAIITTITGTVLGTACTHWLEVLCKVSSPLFSVGVCDNRPDRLQEGDQPWEDDRLSVFHTLSTHFSPPTQIRGKGRGKRDGLCSSSLLHSQQQRFP